MIYAEIGKVRELNGQKFIDDFKKSRIMADINNYPYYLNLKKGDVWDLARVAKIRYYMTEKTPSRMILY